MTRQEFYEKYGNVKVKFSSYYKYTFAFNAVLPDGGIITCECGGNHDDIYRFEVAAGAEDTIRSLEPYAGTAYSKDGVKTDSFYDY